MLSLRHLLEANASVLVLDAASTRIQVGWFGKEEAARWWSGFEEAGTGLFRGIEAVCSDPMSVGAWAFCDGPGSILGIRTAAMALRTWGALAPKPTYAFGSLALVSTALNRPGVRLICDARRGLWHEFGPEGVVRRVPPEALSGELVTPDGFRHWSPLPAGVTTVPYRLEEAFALDRVAEAPLFLATQEPDAFLHEEPEYVKWAPQIHRAP